MASPDYPPVGIPSGTLNGLGGSPVAWRLSYSRQRVWLHILLFLLTLATTSFVGARMVENFELNRPAFNLEEDLDAYVEIFYDPVRILKGLSFAIPLLLILLAHEFGHYFACVYYGLDASLPYFLPAPTFIGTLGAFIRIRSQIYYRRELFDVGVAGPLAGFLFLLPVLAVGLALSKAIPGIAQEGDLVFGTPLMLKAFYALTFPGVPEGDIYLHPVGRAAWVGLFATALNLLPFGQLDGGHILYSVANLRFRMLTRIFWLMLLPLGFLYWPWWAWAVVLFFFGLKHPPIYDPDPLSAGRRKLAWVSLVIFVISFMPAPVATAAF